MDSALLAPAVTRSALPLPTGAAALLQALVDEGVDTGPVIAQVAVPIEAADDEQTLVARIQAAEKPLYVTTIRQLVQDSSEFS